ncbi:hypothetical protein WG904_06230 [Pedobacter sp. Du54]|uniref:hypothetical protein n=1 Tax=Pedobacter anseongensis TaxID=3133439 RepID=UPI00309C7EFF
MMKLFQTGLTLALKHKQVLISDLPRKWNKLDAYPRLQKIGSDWYADKEILKVPSAIITQEYNI